MSVLQAIDLKKYYGTKPNITRALDGVNFSVNDGEFVLSLIHISMYEVMFTDYPDIVNVAQVQSMLKISRHLAYELIGDCLLYTSRCV